jgi:hypothetical protein
MKNSYALIVPLSAILLMLPRIASAQPHDLTHGQPAVAEALVHFGVVPTAPLGPPPCAQTPPFGTVADPCIHKAHTLSPEEVTLLKGGQVTFQVHNGGHALAIYEVSKDTTRDQIGQALCPGDDPLTLQPAEHLCPSGNSSAAHQVFDGHGDVVLLASGSATDSFVIYKPGRLISAGTPAALNGNAVGHTVSYQFLKTGRYLVICINRSHLFNDWMFGFVNVVGGNE